MHFVCSHVYVLGKDQSSFLDLLISTKQSLLLYTQT